MDLIDASLRRPSKLKSKPASKPVNVDRLAEQLQNAINQAIAEAVSDIRGNLQVDVKAPDIPPIDISSVQDLVSRLSADLAMQAAQAASGIKDVKATVDTIRGDIRKINIPEQEVVKGWSFAGFEYDDDGRIVSFTAEATKC